MSARHVSSPHTKSRHATSYYATQFRARGNGVFRLTCRQIGGTLDLAKQRLNRSPTTPGLPEWVSPGRSLRIAQDKVGQHVPPLCASSLPNQPRSPKSPPDRSPIESSDAGVLRLTPLPVWLTVSVPATAPRDYDAGNAVWFFSRGGFNVGGILQRPLGNQKTRLVVRLLGRHTAATQRVKPPPRCWTRVHIPPGFTTRGASACFPRKLAGPASGGAGLPRVVYVGILAKL